MILFDKYQFQFVNVKNKESTVGIMVEDRSIIILNH